MWVYKHDDYLAHSSGLYDFKLELARRQGPAGDETHVSSWLPWLATSGVVACPSTTSTTRLRTIVL